MPAPSLFLKDFTVLDFAFLGPGGVSGDSYFVSAELGGALDAQDFLLDFSAGKKILKALVDETVDHKLLVPSLTFPEGQPRLRWADGDYECPPESLTFLPAAEITPAAIADYLARQAGARLPANVDRVQFRLTSPARFRAEANFRYTHGLRYHGGNCQRLFHGHRNPVEVWRAGSRAADWEARLAAEWDGAHFVAAPTLQNRAELDLSLGRRHAGHTGVAEVAYQSAQGSFRGHLPASRIVLTEGEPSIETMSALALEVLRGWGLRGEVRVVAYEGLNKGAIASGEL